MKHIQKFNERLDARTYLNASKKLATLGHVKRSKELADFSNDVGKRAQLRAWQKNVAEYSKYGTFRFEISNNGASQKVNSNAVFVGDFHLLFTYDSGYLEDSVAMEKDSDTPDEYPVDILFFIAVIPANEECLKECQKMFPKEDPSDGFFWALNLSIAMEVKNERVNCLQLGIDQYDTGLNRAKFKIADRRTANNFKNLLVNLFTEDFEYPSDDDMHSMFTALETSICQHTGFSIDYGFDLLKVRDFIKKINIFGPGISFKSAKTFANQ